MRLIRQELIVCTEKELQPSLQSRQGRRIAPLVHGKRWNSGLHKAELHLCDGNRRRNIDSASAHTEKLDFTGYSPGANTPRGLDSPKMYLRSCCEAAHGACGTSRKFWDGVVAFPAILGINLSHRITKHSPKIISTFKRENLAGIRKQNLG